MQSSSDSAFWSGFAAAYDGHVASREAIALIPRIVAHLNQHGRVLDLGCGTGELALALASKVQRVHAIDFAAGMIEVATGKAAAQGVNNVEFLVHEAGTLPFAEGTFDAVVMANVLHVMEDPDRALREAARVLRPGGILIAPTYCHGQTLRAKMLSYVSVLLFGIRVHNRWNSEQVLDHVGRAGFLAQEYEMVPYRLPLVFVVATKRFKAAQTSALGARTPAHTGRYVHCRVFLVGAAMTNRFGIPGTYPHFLGHSPKPKIASRFSSTSIQENRCTSRRPELDSRPGTQ